MLGKRGAFPLSGGNMLWVGKYNVYRFLMRKRRSVMADTARVLSSFQNRTEIEEFQVRRFNEIWNDAWCNVPFYSSWKQKYDLPDKIHNLHCLASWPVLSKADLRDLTMFKRLHVPEPKGRILTGGSTGEPVRLPSWGDSMSGVNQMLGRGAYGIEPGDRTFLLWGHEHLYGTGFKRKINALKRRFKDWLADWERVSAYDLSAQAMHEAYKVFARFQPKFVIGFSPAVLAFVRHNNDMAKSVDSVRVILCTAGPLTPDEKSEIESFFGGTVCMEYGSVECGIMAYTRPKDGQYDVFWNTHLLQTQRQPEGEYKNLVTRLTDCYIPLIRYDIGDYLEIDEADAENAARSVLQIKSIKGRPSEMINFKCGVSFFGALIGDCVKQVPEIISSQIVVKEDTDKLEIRVTANEALTEDKLSIVKNRFGLTVADSNKLDIKVVQVEKLFTTIGGKIPRVVRG